VHSLTSLDDCKVVATKGSIFKSRASVIGGYFTWLIEEQLDKFKVAMMGSTSKSHASVDASALFE